MPRSSRRKKLQSDEAYHAAHVKSAKEYKKMKLQRNDKYHAAHIKNVKEHKKKKNYRLT